MDEKASAFAALKGATVKVTALATATLIVFLHLFRLREFPGLHYDEAWAMNYSWRIAAEPGFWPWAAMSPYTAPWAHYWAALWLKLLGPSLAVFRGSQVSLSLAGLAALGFALPRGERSAFPWAVLLVPGLVLNHRFAIELTGLHALAFGLLCLSLRRRAWAWATAVALVGTTGHILFYGVALGLLGTICLQDLALEKRARFAFVAYFGFTALFFVQVLVAIPEKGKAAALIISALVAAIFILAGGDRWKGWRSARWWRALSVLAAVFVVNAVFFGQGFWLGSIYTGLSFLWDERGLLFFVGGCLAFAGVLWSAGKACPPFWKTWLFASTFFLGLMMLKPTPRYFELTLLGFAAVLALDLKHFNLRKVFQNSSLRNRTLPLLRLALAVNLASYLIFTYSASVNFDTSLRFLFFKDSSRDFLDKQSLVKFLGSSGCALSGIETHDPRLLETFKALSLGDWAVDGEKKCPYVYVARKTEEGASGEAFGEFFLTKRN